jgi:hypothetical protein
MGREFASGDMDDLGGLDAAELERALSQGDEMDPASLPSFKRLPQHRRADRRRAEIAGDPPVEPETIPPRHAMRVPPPTRPRVPEPAWLRVPEPARMPVPARVSEPLQLTEAMQLGVAMPPPRRQHRRPWRAAALLLLGAVLGAIGTLALSGTPPEGGTVVVSKYLAVLPPAAPAAPPPQIVYVDKWQIVAPEPRLLQPYEVLAPAMPAVPPPQIVMIERATAPVPPRRVVESKRPPTLPARSEQNARAPQPQPEQRDVAKELERWLSGTSDRR